MPSSRNRQDEPSQNPAQKPATNYSDQPAPGHWKGREETRLAALEKARAAATRVVSAKANEAYADLAGTVDELRGKGLSLRAIAGELNKQVHTTRRGRPWNAVQVSRVLERLPNR